MLAPRRLLVESVWSRYGRTCPGVRRGRVPEEEGFVRVVKRNDGDDEDDYTASTL
jgi:hypothetical protein